ncbi:MAG: efflux RND transporter periplasmic adaptor subunit [Wenzhouxiangellaceae bacterium]|nr:efflux RND transporter periplasmic adaptor subunit [Wenzhouxiangellaceae bacterium]
MMIKNKAFLINRSTSLHVQQLLLTVIAVFGLAGCEPVPRAVQEPSASARPVRVIEARAAGEADAIRVPGALRARQRAELAFLDDGYIAQRDVTLGQQVVAGQRLATLYNPLLQPGLAAAQADLREAAALLEQLETDTRRQQSLVERKLISEDELDQTRTRRNAARASREQALARMEQARAQLDDAALRAPFDGRVTDLMLEPGDFVQAGQPLMRLANTQQLEARVELPAARAALLQSGQAVELLFHDSGRTVAGRIVEIGNAAPGRPVPVVVEPAIDLAAQSGPKSGPMASAFSASLQPGAPLYVTFTSKIADAVTVPLAAIIDPGTGVARLFRVRHGKAERVSVQMGQLRSGWVEVDGPIEAGDPVVIAGQSSLLDGEAVRVIR